MTTDASGRPGPEVPLGGDAPAAPALSAPASFPAPAASAASNATSAPAAPPPSAPMSRVGVFALVAALVVALDHLTKWIVIQKLPFHRDVPIFGEWVMLTHIKNTGGAFGLFPGSTLPLILVSSVASIVLCVLAVRLRHDWTRLLALALILGGAIGNLIDRIVAGKVTDFIHVGIPNGPRWPIFNVADSAVSIGVVILGFLVYFRKHEEPAADPVTSPDPAAAAAPGASAPGAAAPPGASTLPGAATVPPPAPPVGRPDAAPGDRG